MNVEQYIKSKLDGRFFRLDLATGKVSEEGVPKDHIPEHKPRLINDIVPTDPNYVRYNTRPFSAEDDDRLLEMRNAGERWEIITRRMKRAQSTLRARYLELCFDRGIQPYDSNASPKRLTAEVKAEIVRLRDMGMLFSEINRTLGLGEYTARDYYHRYSNQRQAQGRAA